VHPHEGIEDGQGTTTAPANPAKPTVIPMVSMAARLSSIPSDWPLPCLGPWSGSPDQFGFHEQGPERGEDEQDQAKVSSC